MVWKKQISKNNLRVYSFVKTSESFVTSEVFFISIFRYNLHSINKRQQSIMIAVLCERGELNPHVHRTLPPQDSASTDSATSAFVCRFQTKIQK